MTTYLCFKTVGFDDKPDGNRHMLKYNGSLISHNGKNYVIRTLKYVMYAKEIYLAGSDKAALEWLKS